MTLLVSIVIPTHNESSNINELYSRLAAVANKSDDAFEIIFVDDSTDDTPCLIKAICKTDSRIRLVRLTRSFGQTVAIQAGLDVAMGQVAVIMDADLQDPPELIPEFVDKWRLGFKVVYAVRSSHGSWLYRTLGSLFYWTLSKLSSTQIPRNAGEFRLLDRDVINFVKSTSDKTRFLRGLTVWPGYPTEGIKISRSSRHSGASNYNLKRSLAVAIDGIVGYSLAPLRLVTWLGIAIIAGAVLVTLAWLLFWILSPGSFGSGWISTIVLLMFFGGTNILMLGVVAEYVGRIYSATQNRPLYVVSEIFGLAAEASGGSTHDK